MKVFNDTGVRTGGKSVAPRPYVTAFYKGSKRRLKSCVCFF